MTRRKKDNLRTRARKGAGLPIPPEVTDDGRAVWAAAGRERWRVRFALYALGFERLGFRNYTHDSSGILATYDEVFSGPLGTVIVRWNQ